MPEKRLNIGDFSDIHKAKIRRYTYLTFQARHFILMDLRGGYGIFTSLCPGVIRGNSHRNILDFEVRVW